MVYGKDGCGANSSIVYRIEYDQSKEIAWHRLNRTKNWYATFLPY